MPLRVLLPVLLFLVVLGAACVDEPKSLYKLTATRINNAVSNQLEIMDVTGDRSEDIIMLQREKLTAHVGDTFTSRIEYIPHDYNNVYDQVNLTDHGNFVVRFDPETKRAIFVVFTLLANRTCVIREYDMEGPLLRELKPYPLPDRNGNDIWEGIAIPFAILDVNKDGVEDIAVNFRATRDWKPRSYTVFSGVDGSPIWDFSCPSIPNSEDSAIADLDGDGDPEFIIGTSACANGAAWDGYDDLHSFLFVLRLDGSILWKLDGGGKFSDVRVLDVRDVDGDDVPEITYLRETHNELAPEPEGIYVVEGATSKLKRFHATSRRFLQHHATADIDSNGTVEHVLLEEGGGICIFDPLLNELDYKSLPELFDARGLITFDFDEDGKREIIVYSNAGELRVYSSTLEHLASNQIVHRGNLIYGCNFAELDAGADQPKQLFIDNGSVFEIRMEQDLTALAADLRTPIIIGSVIIICVLLVILLRRTGELELEKSKLRHLLASENDRGIVVINNKMHIENANDALMRYVEPNFLRWLSAGTHQETLTQNIHGLLAQLRESPSQEMGLHGVPVRLRHESKSVDILARKITDHRGDTRGVVVNIRDTWQQQWARTAAENVHIGQELMHKIKTLISVYRNDIYMLRKLVEENAERERYLEIINEMFAVSEDITEITKAFLRLSKIDQSRRELSDFNRLLVDTVKPVAGSTQKSITFDFQLAGDLAPILMDQEQLQSLILNLVENAINAVGDEGRIILRTEFFRRFSEEAQWGLRNYLALSIEDTGSGFDEKLVNRIFEPGYSGFPGRIGLGLTICKRIVDNHDGEIFISSVEKKGTIVTVRLPYKD